MKKSILFILSFAFLFAFGQAPQYINYQAIARNNGAILNLASITVQFKIHDGSATGPVIYTEQSSDSTNVYGLFTNQIGAGTQIGSNSFSSINWSSGPKFLEVDMDPNGGLHLPSLGTTQLISVPYALYANKADTANYASSAPIQPTAVNISGNQLTVNGVPVTLPDFTPVGTISAFGGTVAPAGWLLCNGASYPDTGRYANLWSVISSNFGGGSGSFNVPDFRGRFLRGVDSTGTNDPDAGSRTHMNAGGQTGANVGSVESDQVGTHNHTQNAHSHGISDPGHTHEELVPYYANGGTSNTFSATHGLGGNSDAGVATQSNTTGIQINNATATNNPYVGSETRPKNAYVNYIIKY